MIADLRAGLDELEPPGPGAKVGDDRLLLRRRHDVAAARRRRAAARRRPSRSTDRSRPDANLSGSPNAAVLGIYAGNDARVNATKDAAEAALDAPA